jgi:hypothetical protein
MRDFGGFLPNNTTGFVSASGRRFRGQAGDSSCGCIHPIAMNYNPYATANDGSCIFNFGCTIPTADNYDSNAVLEDGSCQGGISSVTNYLTYIAEQNQEVYADYGITYGADEACMMGGSLGDQDEASGGGSGTISGCTDPMAENFDPNADYDNGSCVFIEGCLVPFAENYNAYAVVEDLSCIFGNGIYDASQLPQPSPYIGGCIATNAMNYNPLSSFNDGSCQFQFGCTDPTAYNYDSQAVIDDGSCNVYAEGDPVGPTGPNVGDLLDQLADAAGGATGSGSGGSSGGMVTDSGGFFEKDPKSRQRKKPKNRFSGFAGRDECGFVSSGFQGDVFTEGAPPSQPYIASVASV